MILRNTLLCVRFFIIRITFSIMKRRHSITSTFSGRVVQPSSELQKLLEPIHLPFGATEDAQYNSEQSHTSSTRTPSPPNPTLLIQVHNTPQTRKPSFHRTRLAPTERKITMHTPAPSLHVLASAQRAHSERLLIKFNKTNST